MDAGCSGERGFSSRFLCWVWPFARTTVIKPSAALSSLLAHNLSSSCLRYIYPLSLPPPLSLTDTCAHPMYTPHIHTYIHSTQVSLTPFRHPPAHSLYSLRLTPASARMCLQRHACDSGATVNYISFARERNTGGHRVPGFQGFNPFCASLPQALPASP